MRLTLVADNATSPNWGCRATSFALREILSSRHEIVGTISRSLLSAPLTSRARLSPAAYEKLVRAFRRPRVARVPVLGPMAISAIDAVGTYHVPSHDVRTDAGLLWSLQSASPKARAIVSEIECCDAIVVNGEGEMIFSTPARETLLQTLAICVLAKRMGKSIFYVNAMVSKPTAGETNHETAKVASGVLARARVAVRDPRSADMASAFLPEIETCLVPDALFTWSRHFRDQAAAPYDQSRLRAWFDRTGQTLPTVTKRPYIVLSGSSHSAIDQQRAAQSYCGLAKALRGLGLPVLLVETCIGDVFLRSVAREMQLPILRVDTPIMAGAAIMAHARLFVSGRWHPGIMASLGGTPSVTMGSNSHKTLALQEILQYADPVEYSAFPDAADAEAITAAGKALLDEGEDRRLAIAARAADLASEVPQLLELIA
ncbi:polysaccharide pyruvyl transferase family protein [Novosphingobium album (ex Liu et al. 2023)]|uniref:Polysaccharide pyruvyl transferase family protein n=1 Tax=Novosphingobium album (ex Liu et al. 2023) TaxID=3031130 RepID=A0ABT5WTI0_9SPHN|nr:polysaccharide pyruvyl transferase family protein [Novosphingobium album (ex Liu et al. 2023)]MDE8653187.1 polysaccharide pyruvyl transferase family protein [Novosphingobium album (ex Liu et al. 2023)]